MILFDAYSLTPEKKKRKKISFNLKSELSIFIGFGNFKKGGAVLSIKQALSTTTTKKKTIFFTKFEKRELIL